MKKFEPVTEPIEGIYYKVGIYDGVKCIHILGSIVGEDYPDAWCQDRYNHFVMSLHYFVYHIAEDNELNFMDDYNRLDYETAEEELSDEKMAKIVNHYFDGKAPDAYLNFCELNNDTPCGNYIHMGVMDAYGNSDYVKSPETPWDFGKYFD